MRFLKLMFMSVCGRKRLREQKSKRYEKRAETYEICRKTFIRTYVFRFKHRAQLSQHYNIYNRHFDGCIDVFKQNIPEEAGRG